jgi:site-specific DNA-methyltransferase (adenine-specific)
MKIIEAMQYAPDQKFTQVFKDASQFGAHKRAGTRYGRGDSGSAARFFYCAPRGPEDRGIIPLSLLRYLCRLITPPSGIVFDPFPNDLTPVAEAVSLEGFQTLDK